MGELKKKLVSQIHRMLGGTMVGVELEEEDILDCIELAFDRYRQRSGNSMEESVLFLDLQPDVATYTLPSEIQEVIEMYRRVNGSNSGGSAVDPFSLSFANNLYSIYNPTMMGFNGQGGTLAMFDFAAQYQEMAGRMFGRDIQFTWDAPTKKVTIQRKINAVEQVAFRVLNARPEEVILSDVYAKPWIRSYALAQAKLMLGQARGKFASLAGPQGGIQFNGDALKAEAKEELDKLEEEIKNLIEQRHGYSFTIG